MSRTCGEDPRTTTYHVATIPRPRKRPRNVRMCGRSDQIIRQPESCVELHIVHSLVRVKVNYSRRGHLFGLDFTSDISEQGCFARRDSTKILHRGTRAMRHDGDGTIFR